MPGTPPCAGVRLHSRVVDKPVDKSVDKSVDKPVDKNLMMEPDMANIETDEYGRIVLERLTPEGWNSVFPRTTPWKVATL